MAGKKINCVMHYRLFAYVAQSGQWWTMGVNVPLLPFSLNFNLHPLTPSFSHLLILFDSSFYVKEFQSKDLFNPA